MVVAVGCGVTSDPTAGERVKVPPGLVVGGKREPVIAQLVRVREERPRPAAPPADGLGRHEPLRPIELDAFGKRYGPACRRLLEG